MIPSPTPTPIHCFTWLSQEQKLDNLVFWSGRGWGELYFQFLEFFFFLQRCEVWRVGCYTKILSHPSLSLCIHSPRWSISPWSIVQREGPGNPFQYSCLENPMDRGAWRATVHGVAKSWTRLSNSQFHFPLSQLAWGAITRYHRPGGLNNRLLFSYGSGGVKIRCWQISFW